MALRSGTVDVGTDPVRVCAVPDKGVRIRNLGGSTVFFGGPDVTADGATAGFPIEAGESDTFPGVKPKESPVVPAPEGDLDLLQLYGRTAEGTESRVAWLTVE